MPEIEFENFGVGGILRDKQPYDIEPEYWSAGKNIRFVNGEAVKILGEEEIYPTWSSYSVPLWLLPWRDATATGYWLAATATAILRYTSASITDVTRTSAAYTAGADGVWSGGIIGGIPIMNYDTGSDVPQSWDGTSNFQDLPNWTAGDSCQIIRVFKQFVVAYDITRSGTRYPHMVKWSSPAFPGSVPDFWDNANSNDSNETNLSEGGGFVIDSEVLGDINYIYKEEMTYGMQHIGGEFVFRFFPMPFTSGMLAPRCAKTINGKAVVVTKDDVIAHNGQEAVSVIDKKNRNYLFNNISDTKQRKTFMVPNYPMNELWICFVSNGVNGDYADEALIWNYKDNTWGHKQLFDVPHIGFGLLDKSGISQVIDDQAQLIDTDTQLIDGGFYSSGKLRLLGSQAVTPNSKLIEFDVLNQNLETNMNVSLERIGLTIVGKSRDGTPKVSNFTTKLVQRVYPKIESTGSVNIYIGAQSRLEGSVNWSGPYAFDPLVDNHIDVRVQGKAVAFKIMSSTDISWSSTGCTMEMEVLGGSVR